MVMGCGRIFEGTPEQMWVSLQKFMRLAPDTKIWSGHEYTEDSIKFALTIEPDNLDLRARDRRVAKTRSQGHWTMPSTIAEELKTNPLLRANLDCVKNSMGMREASDVEVFAKIRELKNDF